LYPLFKAAAAALITSEVPFLVDHIKTRDVVPPPGETLL